MCHDVLLIVDYYTDRYLVPCHWYGNMIMEIHFHLVYLVYLQKKQKLFVYCNFKLVL